MLRLIYREAQIKLGTYRVTTDLGLTSTLSDARSHSNNVFPRHIVQKHPPVDLFCCDLPLCLCLLSAMAASCFLAQLRHISITSHPCLIPPPPPFGPLCSIGVITSSVSPEIEQCSHLFQRWRATVANLKSSDLPL